ncbi:MAG: penicillin acylase family protein [Vulcanimicrobiaceae bacterium]
MQRIRRLLTRSILTLFALLALALAVYAGNVLVGMHIAAATSGTLVFPQLHAPVTILRDAADIPHIEAADEHDLFFADGFAEGSDRLFQMDLLRRFVYGQLAQVLGAPALRADEAARVVPVRAIVKRQWAHLSPHDKAILTAFSDGVNAAMRSQPLPVEFRILLYSPAPWTPKDSLAVGFATVLDLTDTWNDIAPRDAVYRAHGLPAVNAAFPLSDPCYNAPVTAGLSGMADPRHCAQASRKLIATLLDHRPPVGSNEWAAGSARTIGGHALLANDPHLSLAIPGVWYLVDLRSPGFHVAGASLAGTPGVILGHNDTIAWGATDGTVASLSVFAAPSHLPARNWHTQTFGVRFSRSVTVRYYRSATEFGAWIHEGTHHRRLVLVRWNAYDHPRSPLPTFARLDRARSLTQALAALRAYPGPTQNFVLASTSGRVAYQLAGFIPDDPAWARYVHRSSAPARHFGAVPYKQLPHVAPSRRAVVWTANNQMYPAGYPLRLSAQFAPPYRAYRIAELLRARTRYSLAYFAHMQLDTLSLPERELAHLSVADAAHVALAPAERALLARLATWKGHFDPASRGAGAAAALRIALTSGHNGRIVRSLIALRAQRARHSLPLWQYTAIGRALVRVNDTPKLRRMATHRWRRAGAVQVYHPLAALGASFLNGTRFSGNGDAYTIHMQQPAFSQSFRAVWKAGDWNAGGIVIPQGESGEPGSGHYTDLARTWTNERLVALPFTRAAVAAAARERLTLRP